MTDFATVEVAEPFASMVRDPEGLIAREMLRLPAGSEIACLIRRLGRDWSPRQWLAFCACASLIEKLPATMPPLLDATDWERETDHMPPRILVRVPAILLLDLQEDRPARDDVDRAFSILHRIARLETNPPTP